MTCMLFPNDIAAFENDGKSFANDSMSSIDDMAPLRKEPEVP